MQRQDETGSFVLGGIDGEKSLPNKGTLRFAVARSQGEIMGVGNFFDSGLERTQRHRRRHSA